MEWPDILTMVTEIITEDVLIQITETDVLLTIQEIRAGDQEVLIAMMVIMMTVEATVHLIVHQKTEVHVALHQMAEADVTTDITEMNVMTEIIVMTAIMMTDAAVQTGRPRIHGDQIAAAEAEIEDQKLRRRENIS